MRSNADGTVNISHERSERWAADHDHGFPPRQCFAGSGIQPGSAISFEIVERKPDEWVITKLLANSAKPHEGH